MKFKIGDRVKIKGTDLCGEKGSVFEVKFSTVWVLLDGTGQKIGLSPSQVIRLVKKKSLIKYDGGSGSATTPDIKITYSSTLTGSPHITREQLAKAWNKFVWCNNHYTHSSESILFEAFCRELGV